MVQISCYAEIKYGLVWEDKSSSSYSFTGLPPNQRIQGISGYVIFNQGISGEKENCLKN